MNLLFASIIFGLAGVALAGAAFIKLQQPAYIATSRVTPAALVRTSNDPQTRYLQPDIEKIRSQAQAYINQHPDSSISLYFEYLPSQQTIEIQADRGYNMMSLSKLPIIITLFQQVDAGLVDLDSEVTIQPEDLDEQYGTLWLQGAGRTITLREALRAAIEESDNTAIKLILRYVCSHMTPARDPKAGLDVSRILQMHADGVSTDTRSYSGMLRCLYTACLLTPSSSKTILGYMTHTENSALRDGIGSGAVVADKFGFYDKPGHPYIYSDCGIVYTGNGNYTLCIMSQHETKNIRASSVELSRIVYRGVTRTE